MITNITPEDREHWDKKMKAHSRRLKRQERAPQIRKVGVIALALILAAACLFLNIRDRATFQPATAIDDSRWKILDDTMHINRGKIPDDARIFIKPENMPVQGKPPEFKIIEWKGPPPGWTGIVFWDSTGDFHIKYHSKVVARSFGDSCYMILDKKGLEQVKQAFERDRKKQLLRWMDSV